MKSRIDKLPEDIKGLIYLASDVASSNNARAYLAGGFVRDLILGAANLDLDIVVEGDGIHFAEDLSGRLGAKLTCHRRFGTATLSLRHNLKIDIASARRETYPEPASLPLVSTGTMRDDLARRDFTINAMAISISGSDFGRLLDYFSSQDDLRRKKIRVLHALSFIDDPTRILRAIRFEQRYNFKIEPETLAWLKDAVRLKMLDKVEPQRVRDELILDLKEEGPLNELRRISKLVGFAFISKRLKMSKNTSGLLLSAQRQIQWFKKNYSKRRPLDSWLIYLTALIDSLPVKEARAMCRKFALRRGEEKRISCYKKLSRKFINELKQPGLRPSKIFALLEPLSYEVIILLKARYADKNMHRHIEDFFEIYNGMRILIRGEDLRRLGVTPGPYYQKIFAKVLQAKLEGIVKTKEEELALIRKLVRQ